MDNDSYRSHAVLTEENVVEDNVSLYGYLGGALWVHGFPLKQASGPSPSIWTREHCTEAQRRIVTRAYARTQKITNSQGEEQAGERQEYPSTENAGANP